MDPSNKCGDADKLFCCFCNKPTSGAHHCRKCSRPCHAIPPCSLSSDGEEGYGSKVICGGCDLIGDSDIDENSNPIGPAKSTSKATTEDMMFSQQPRKRRGFTIKEKLDIIEHAKKTSIHAASRHFKVCRDSIRCWKKEEANLRKMKGSCKRKRLSGAGRKLTDANFDDDLANWVRELREKKLRVTRTMVFSKAQQISANYTNLENFSASNGWLESFMSRHSFSLRKPTTLAQKPPDDYAEAIINFIVYVQKLWHEKNYSGVFACDETAVWLDPTGGNCVSEKGAKSVTVLTTGHEKARVTVMLTARSDGTKLRPFVLLPKKRPVPAIVKRFKNDLVLCWCGRTWMDNELTTKFLEVLGNFAFGRRLLIWDSFRCHISADTKQTLRRLSIESAVIPGGTTKYIQPPDVCWNAPFKNKIRQIYDEWMVNGEKETTSSGNLKAPPMETYLQWIVTAWNLLPKELIAKSFLSCGITDEINGSNDELINVFKADGAIPNGLELLNQRRKEENVVKALEQIDLGQDESDVSVDVANE